MEYIFRPTKDAIKADLLAFMEMCINYDLNFSYDHPSSQITVVANSYREQCDIANLDKETGNMDIPFEMI